MVPDFANTFPKRPKTITSVRMAAHKGMVIFFLKKPEFETDLAAARAIVWEQAVIGSEAFPDLDTMFEAAVVYFVEFARVDYSLTHPLLIAKIQLCIDVISYYNMCLR